eukprot:5453052-Amphidinium_carterae.1
MQRLRMEIEQSKAGEARGNPNQEPLRNPIPNNTQQQTTASQVPPICLPSRAASRVSVGWKPTLHPVHKSKPGTVYSRKAKKSGGREPPSSDSSSSSSSSEKSDSSKSSDHGSEPSQDEIEDTNKAPLRRKTEVHNIATPRSPIPVMAATKTRTQVKTKTESRSGQDTPRSRGRSSTGGAGGGDGGGNRRGSDPG